MTRRWGIILLTGLTLAVIALALGIIVLQLRFWQLPLTCLIMGMIAAKLNAKKALLLFFFLLPLINSTPDLFFNGYPFNYMAPALFLLAGIFLASLARKDERFTPPGWLSPYLFFLSILWLSALFIFLRWSNLTLSAMAFLKDTPVAPTGDRLSFAAIFPVITLFLFTLAPWLALLLQRYGISRREAMRPLMAGFSFSLLLAVWQKTLFPDFLAQAWWAKIGQHNGGFSDFNGLGFYSGVLFIATFLDLLGDFFPNPGPTGLEGRENSRRGSIRKIIFPALALTGILISGSRSAFFFVIAALAVFLFNRSIRLRYRILASSVLILALLMAGGPLARRLGKMGKQIGKLFSTSDVTGALDRITNGRIAMLRNWSGALVRFPFAGVGAGNFLFYYRYENYNRSVYEDLPLNQYLHIAVETGLIGLLAFAFFLACFWRAQRRPVERITVTAILIILFVNTAFWLPECILLFFLFASGASGGPCSKPSCFRIRLPVLTVLLVFALANMVTFPALHPVNWANKCRTGYDYGLFPIEKEAHTTVRWSMADFGFYLHKGETEAVKIHCAAPLDRLPGKSQAVHIYWNGTRLASKSFTRNDKLEIPIKGRAGFLEFRVSPLFSPRSLRLSADPRQLGVQVLLSPTRRP